METKPKKINPLIHIVLGIVIAALGALIVFMVISNRVTYEEQELQIRTQDENKVNETEVKSPNVQTVNMSIVSTIVSEQVAEPEEPVVDGEYVFADSNARYLEEDEIYALTKEEMRIARNEIYARLGRKFTDPGLQEYFDSKSWYTPVYDAEEFDAMGDEIFNEYEYANKTLITEIEEELGYK